MNKKITDLEKFCLEQVYWPYQSMLPGGQGKRLEKLIFPYDLDNALPLLKDYKDWASLVLNRIQGCKFYFPSYIKHPLVTFINKQTGGGDE